MIKILQGQENRRIVSQQSKCYHKSELSGKRESSNFIIDLRSDTLTKPSSAMRKTMFDASVGDDVYKEDETINELERVAAQLFSMEKALFVPTGNFLSLLSF